MTLDELDRLAAEKVMGFFGMKSGAQYWWNSEHEIAYCRIENYDSDFQVWQPTRNISQAWECLEQVGVFTLALKTYHDGSEYAYHVILPGNITVTSTSATEAIVLACLRARGIDIPTGDRGGSEV